MLLSSINHGQMPPKKISAFEILLNFAITFLFGGDSPMRNFLYSFIILLFLQGYFFENLAASQISPDWSQPLQPCWQFKTSEMSVFPALNDSKQNVFLPLADGSLIALEAFSGKILWRSQFGGELIAQPLHSDGKVFVLHRINTDAGEDFVFRAVSAISGLTVLQKNLEIGKNSRAFLISDENFIFLFGGDGSINVFEKFSGNKVWSKIAEAVITSPPFLAENKIFVGAGENRILMLSAKDGTLLDAFESENSFSGNLNFAGGTLFFGDRLGNVNALHLNDKKILWKFRTGAGIVDLAIVGENLLATSNDGFVYMLSQKSGKRIWKRRLAGRLIGKTLLNHRYLLVQTLDGALLPVFDAANGKIVNQLNLSENAFAINGAVGDEKIIIVPTNQGLQAFANNCQKQ